ncbi:cytochrome c3 family protein [Trichlorobacter lovleyi]|uniref:Fumarate reductase flavoprotein subunit n=1 Tax=Trichlorobacter lovleyi (strain ATCC BAA-1151 / DSM 17278 / SZ) TaxID=398767 RepID=B3E5J8_TRIL1|nr:cytochrome c3 family protein [Trichlorobacter lovleyi]ACD94669.1 fumarate reductase flavoprotein subunit precursor [Trichlorobacter lovleyi SZ]
MFRIPFKLFFILTLLTVTVAGANALTVGGPHATMGFKCADCHKTDAPQAGPTNEACLSCHGSYEQLAAKTKPKHIANPADKEAHANPHESHMGPINCTDCHRTHKPSELVCGQCHTFDFVPK